MKIQVVSDLHLEFADFDLKNAGADVLVLSGDILIAKYFDKKSPDSSSQGYQQYNSFLKRVSNEFENVVYVAGNHEFYGGKWEKTLQLLQAQCAQYSNIHFLEAQCVTIGDIIFMGATMWTDMNNRDPLTMHGVRYMMSDYKAIKNDTYGYRPLKVDDTVIRHQNSLGYFKHVLKDRPNQKFVCVTHHAPSTSSISAQFLSQTMMNAAFVSNLDEFILDHPQIKLWTHGHTHEPHDYMIGTTRVVCNPRGYGGYESRAEAWQGNEAVIEI